MVNIPLSLWVQIWDSCIVNIENLCLDKLYSGYILAKMIQTLYLIKLILCIVDVYLFTYIYNTWSYNQICIHLKLQKYNKLKKVYTIMFWIDVLFFVNVSMCMYVCPLTSRKEAIC